MAKLAAAVLLATLGGFALGACSSGAGDSPAEQGAKGDGAVPVEGHPDPLSLLSDADPQLAANKRLVFDMWRSIVNAGHVHLADQFLQEDYIQHSPTLPTGRAGFVQVFSAVPRTRIPATVSPALVAIPAEGDLVVMALQEEQEEPSGARYTTTHFNLFRVKDGRLSEHWHSVDGVPGPDLPPANQGGPQPVTGAEGAAQNALLTAKDATLAANKRTVFDAWRTVIEGGKADQAEKFFAADYIEHDPNGRSGTEALRARLAAGSAGAGEGARDGAAALANPLVAMVAAGDLVVMVTGRTHPHPTRAGESYTTTKFNMFRLKDGQIVEHWSGEGKPGGKALAYGS